MAKKTNKGSAQMKQQKRVKDNDKDKKANERRKALEEIKNRKDFNTTFSKRKKGLITKAILLHLITQFKVMIRIETKCKIYEYISNGYGINNEAEKPWGKEVIKYHEDVSYIFF